MGTRSYKKKIRKSIVIIGEGLTEYRYVDDIRTEERYRFSLVPGIPKHPDLDDIVNLATRRLNEGNDYVLCLVDMDVINNSFDKKEHYKALKKEYSKIIFVESSRKHSANPVLTFKDYEAFSEKVGIFRRNLYKFVDIFGVFRRGLETDYWIMVNG